MNRTEFIIATAIILLVAFAMGWFTYWLMHRFTRVAGGDMGEMDRLAQSLHEAEEIRDQAIIYLESREAELLNQIDQTEAELSDMRRKKCATISSGCTPTVDLAFQAKRGRCPHAALRPPGIFEDR